MYFLLEPLQERGFKLWQPFEGPGGTRCSQGNSKDDFNFANFESPVTSWQLHPDLKPWPWQRQAASANPGMAKLGGTATGCHSPKVFQLSVAGKWYRMVALGCISGPCLFIPPIVSSRAVSDSLCFGCLINLSDADTLARFNFANLRNDQANLVHI